MNSFDKWARDLADQLREKEQTQEIKPEDLYTHKDIMRGEGMFSPDYNPANVKVTFDGEEINPVKDQHKGMDPPFGFNVRGNWFRDQQAYDEFLKLEEYAKLQEQARLLLEELDKAPKFVLGYNCTSTETVESISPAPDIDYNGAYSAIMKWIYPVGSKIEVHPASVDYLKHHMNNCGIEVEQTDVENRPGQVKVIAHFEITAEVYE